MRVIFGAACASLLCATMAYAADLKNASQMAQPIPKPTPTLQVFGIVPPEPTTDAQAHDIWVQSLKGVDHVQPNPEKIPPQPLIHNSVPVSSPNWSGVAQAKQPAWFGNGNIVTQFVVSKPTFKTCDGNAEYMGEWAGLDGVSPSNEVLQGGSIQSVQCTVVGGQQQIVTAAPFLFTEWFPFAATVASNGPSVSFGDTVTVEVWNTSPTVGYVYLYNNNTGYSATYQVAPPPGYHMQGISAEWITELPAVNGILGTLPKYNGANFSGGYAWASSHPIGGTQFLGNAYPGQDNGTLIRSIWTIVNGSNPIGIVDVTGLENLNFCSYTTC